MEDSHKRVAKNTVFLYFRQIVIMLVSLYTSRVILNALGVDDYGIYNVVGGFVSMFNVISGAFSVAITRYMAYILGSGNLEDLRKCYSVSLMIQAVLGMVICLLLATVGVWYVKNVMVLPKGRTGAALWVLLFSAISFFISLINIPYNAMIVAHQHMQAFAYIGIAEAVLKLAVALAVRFSPWDKLIVYSFLTVLSALLTRLLYAIYCRRHFEECHFVWQFDSGLLKEMLAFVSWAFLGNGSVVLRNQGINMIMNLFGGTVVNAARGVSTNIKNIVQSFSNNYIQAIQPEITQLYSADKLDSMRNLIYRSCRYSYYLMLVMCLPLIKNIKYVLQIWLGQVPEYVAGFVSVTLIESLVSSLLNPLLYGVLASGKIKTYEIILTAAYVATLPFSYIALQFGLPMVSVYFITLMSEIVVLFVLIWQSSRTYGLSCKVFVFTVGPRIGAVTALSALVTYMVHLSASHNFINFMLESLISVIGTAVFVFLCGMDREEKKSVADFVRNKVFHKA